jgi:hypothetical protein
MIDKIERRYAQLQASGSPASILPLRQERQILRRLGRRMDRVAFAEELPFPGDSKSEGTE